MVQADDYQRISEPSPQPTDKLAKMIVRKSIRIKKTATAEDAESTLTSLYDQIEKEVLRSFNISIAKVRASKKMKPEVIQATLAKLEEAKFLAIQSMNAVGSAQGTFRKARTAGILR